MSLAGCQIYLQKSLEIFNISADKIWSNKGQGVGKCPVSCQLGTIRVKDREISEWIFNLASSSKKSNQITNREVETFRVSALVRFFEEGAKLKAPSAIFLPLHGSKKHELDRSYFEFKTPKCISLSCKIFCDKETIRMTSWHLFTLANFECSVQFAVFRRVLFFRR